MEAVGAGDLARRHPRARGARLPPRAGALHGRAARRDEAARVLHRLPASDREGAAERDRVRDRRDSTRRLCPHSRDAPARGGGLPGAHGGRAPGSSGARSGRGRRPAAARRRRPQRRAGGAACTECRRRAGAAERVGAPRCRAGRARRRRGHRRGRVLAPADLEARRRDRGRPGHERARRVPHLLRGLCDGRALPDPGHHGRAGSGAHAGRGGRASGRGSHRRGRRPPDAHVHAGLDADPRQPRATDHGQGRARRKNGDARAAPHDREAGPPDLGLRPRGAARLPSGGRERPARDRRLLARRHGHRGFARQPLPRAQRSAGHGAGGHRPHLGAVPPGGAAVVPGAARADQHVDRSSTSCRCCRSTAATSSSRSSRAFGGARCRRRSISAFPGSGWRCSSSSW